MKQELSYEAREIKSIRTEAGLSQEQLASRMSVSLRTVSRWEQGITRIPDGTVERARRAVSAKPRVARATVSAATSIDLGMEVLERLRHVEDLEDTNRELRELVEKYKFKYGDL